MRPGPGRRERTARALRAAAFLAFLALASALGSCVPAPRGPAPLDLRDLATRYEVQRAAREGRLAAVRIEATAWIDAPSIGRLPAVQMDIALAGPSQVRARVASLFGTALDLLVRGDSLTAWIPPRRLGVELGSLEDSLGIRRPGEWGCRTLGAAWDPRGARWQTSPGDSLRHVTWIEDGDSLRLDVGARALPVALEIHPAEGRQIHVRYTAWQWIESVAWPSRIEIEDETAEFRLALRMDRVRFERTPDPLWRALVLPASAERLDWQSLKETLARVGGRR